MTPALLVHGGTGAIAVDRHALLRDGVQAGCAAGRAILAAGGSALDAVVAAVRVLEDDPAFNAGIGSALTREGTVETDAALMDGATQRIGAVGAVPDLGQAIRLARAVLDAGEHVLLVGAAALEFAREVGIEPAAPGALVTDRQRARLESAPGTVGAVARDQHGRFAAATSTGGITGKRRGRVGDSPIPGAGTWADAACALSATGDGEAILRAGLTRAIAALVGGGWPLAQAVPHALADLARITGGAAGVIGIDGGGLVHHSLSPQLPVAWWTGAAIETAI